MALIAYAMWQLHGFAPTAIQRQHRIWEILLRVGCSYAYDLFLDRTDKGGRAQNKKNDIIYDHDIADRAFNYPLVWSAVQRDDYDCRADDVTSTPSLRVSVKRRRKSAAISLGWIESEKITLP